MEESNSSEASNFNPENEIRNIQSRIQAELENFEKTPDSTFVKTSNFCDSVRDHILNYQDEPHLSKNQNNRRRIFIASELFMNFCPIYAHVVDHDYAAISMLRALIEGVMQSKKYRELSRKITYKMLLELRREKYFSGEAETKLVKGFEDTAVENAETDTIERVSETEVVTRHEEQVASGHLQQTEGTEVATPRRELNAALAPSFLESSFRTEPTSISGNLTEIREAAEVDATQMEIPVSDALQQQLSAANLDAEISIGAPTLLQKTNEDIEKILEILQEEIFPKETVEIDQPGIISESADKIPESVLDKNVTENVPTDDIRLDASEDSEMLSLPSLEATESARKKRRIMIDQETIIRDYAERSSHLNRNIKIQRIQVFEGPPTVIQAMSVNHLMTTPSHENSLVRVVQDSKLSTLYTRHLVVEKKPVEEVYLKKRTTEELREIDVTKLRANSEIMEEVGMRVGMHSTMEKSDNLVEIPEKGPPIEPVDVTSTALPPKESLIGVPISRIINSTIGPPEEDQMNRINNTAITSTPRVLQLQGKSLDVRTSPPWFISTKEKPPNAKYREFNYILNKLKQYWSIFENQGMEKCITMHEFFSFEAGGSIADYLTMFRIVDKLSIQRKLLLEYNKNDLVIRPFESSYVSDAQLALKETEPVF